MLQTDGIIPVPSYEWLLQQHSDKEERSKEIDSLSTSELARRFGATALALGVAYSNAPTLAFGVQDMLESRQANYQYCRPTDSDERTRIASLLADNNNVDIETRFDFETTDESDYATYEDSWYREKAKLWNLTVPGFRAEFSDLRTELATGNESSTSSQEYLDRTNAFLEQYGVRVSADREDIHPGSTAISAEDFDSMQFKHHLYDVIRTFGIWPTELVRTLHSVELVVIQRLTAQDASDGSDGVPAGLYDAEAKTILLHYDHSSSSVVQHEVGHAINDGLGCRWDDPVFRSLNPESIYVDRGVDPTDIPRYISADISDQQRAFDELRVLLFEAVRVGDTAKAQRLRSEVLELGKRFVTYTEYSRRNAEEDKAEVLTALQGDLQYDNTYTNLETNSEEFPVLYAKRLELLSRLDRFYPGVAGYLGDISAEPTVLEGSWYYDEDEWAEVREHYAGIE